jgi:hypothetical protein
MKKTKFQNQFFEELRKIPIVQVGAEKTGLSRNSIYRWRKQDKKFAQKMDQALSEGVAFVNDMSESQLLTLIKEKNYQAISFWLRHRNDNYKNKVEISGTISTKDEPLTKEQKKLIREALKLSSLKKYEKEKEQ